MKKWIDEQRWHKDDCGNEFYLDSDGNKYWYQNGLRHREDGPAIEYCRIFNSWWYKGKQINCSSQKEFEKYLKLKLFW